MDNNFMPDRVIADFEPPPPAPLSHDLLFPEKASRKTIPDWKALRDHLNNEGGYPSINFDIFQREKAYAFSVFSSSKRKKTQRF